MKKLVNVIISLLFTVVVFWLSFYGGALLKIEIGGESYWYETPYVFTCFVVCVFFFLLSLYFVNEWLKDK